MPLSGADPSVSRVHAGIVLSATCPDFSPRQYDNCGKQNLNRARKAYRTAEKKAADEAIVGFEEDDE